MGTPLRVVHYLNQFFAGIGGEDVANIPPRMQDGPMGSGRPLQQILKNDGTVVATLVCGDNYLNDERDTALAAIVAMLQELKPDVLIAGPAFESGRYGLACAEVCKAAQRVGIPALTGMHPDNPGVESGRPDVLVVPTGASPAEMQAALTAMARLAIKLGCKETLGPAEVEGFLPRGVRRTYPREAPGYRRALEMLKAKLQKRPFTTEVPILIPERVTPARPITDLAAATIALVTTGGLVRKGNPDRQVSANATRYFRHDVSELESLSGKDWEAYHAGYFNHIVNRNPNYILPLSFMRDLERKGEVGGVYPHIYALPGVSTPVAQARRMGADIARELTEARVDGCLLVATWGTCNRCGATMTKEIERVGIPTAQISAIYEFAMTTGANRVVRGSRIEHVCGDPDLGPEKDYAYGLRIIRTALKALQTPVDGPTLFDPATLLDA